MVERTSILNTINKHLTIKNSVSQRSEYEELNLYFFALLERDTEVNTTIVCTIFRFMSSFATDFANSYKDKEQSVWFFVTIIGLTIVWLPIIISALISGNKKYCSR